MKIAYPDTKNKLVFSEYNGRFFGVLPCAYVMEGSVLRKIVFGFTPNHAVNRGLRYLRKYGSGRRKQRFLDLLHLG